MKMEPGGRQKCWAARVDTQSLPSWRVYTFPSHQQCQIGKSKTLIIQNPPVTSLSCCDPPEPPCSKETGIFHDQRKADAFHLGWPWEGPAACDLGWEWEAGENPKTGLDQLISEVPQTGLTSFGLSKGSVALVLQMPVVQSINLFSRWKTKKEQGQGWAECWLHHRWAGDGDRAWPQRQGEGGYRASVQILRGQGGPHSPRGQLALEQGGGGPRWVTGERPHVGKCGNGHSWDILNSQHLKSKVNLHYFFLKKEFDSLIQRRLSRKQQQG